MTNDCAVLNRRIFRLEDGTLAWMAIEAAVANGSGVAAESRTDRIGVDGLIELASSGPA